MHRARVGGYREAGMAAQLGEPADREGVARIDTGFLRQGPIERPVFSRADPDDPHTAPFHSGGECDVMRPALALPTTAAPGVKQGEPSVPEPVGLAPA